MVYRELIRFSIALMVGFLAVAGIKPVLAQSASVDFDATAVCTKAATDADRAKVDFYVEVPYANLEFSPSPRGFVARYRVAAAIAEIGTDGVVGNKVESSVWDRTVRLASHAETRHADRSDLTTHSLLLDPGQYLVEVSLTDEASGNASVREMPIEVRDFESRGGTSVSDLLLLEEYDVGNNVVLPSVSKRFGTERLGFSVMYELYVDRPRDVRISRSVFQTASTIANEVPQPVLVIGEPVYQDNEATHIDATRSQHIVTIPINDFQLGQYLVRVMVEDEAGNTLDVAEESFTVDWKGLAEHIRNIDEAISQLVYIAQPREIRYLKDGRTGAERLSRFVEFWRKRDPTPGTRRNERMEEYYYRVSHANERYGTLTDGWKTDRGEVVVLFGEPDYIERHPYNFNVEPYEIWYYYRIGKRFIFVDRTGLGDYEILIPHWDDRTRIR